MKITTRLEKEFQRELRVRITITGLTCDPCPSTTRTQGTLSVKDAVSLVTLYSTDSG